MAPVVDAEVRKAGEHWLLHELVQKHLDGLRGEKQGVARCGAAAGGSEKMRDPRALKPATKHAFELGKHARAHTAILSSLQTEPPCEEMAGRPKKAELHCTVVTFVAAVSFP